MNIHAILGFLTLSAVVLLSGCAVPFSNQAGQISGCFGGTHGQICAGGQGNNGQQTPIVGTQVIGALRPNCPPGLFPGILHKQNDAKNGQIVCAPSGDPYVSFIQYQQNQGNGGQAFQAPVRRFTPPVNLNANDCPSGFRQIQGKWECMDRYFPQ